MSYQSPLENSLYHTLDIMRLADQEGQQDIYDISKAASQYIVDENVQAVVLMDRAARGMWTGIRTYSQQKYSKKPRAFFVDGDGFKAVDNERDLTEIFETDHPYLSQYKNDPVLVLDTCIHTGETSRPVLSGMEKAGFSDVRFGVVNGTNNDSGLKPDILLLDRWASNGCHPFGSNILVEHTDQSIHTAPAPNLARAQPHARFLRETIAKIVETEGNYPIDATQAETILFIDPEKIVAATMMRLALHERMEQRSKLQQFWHDRGFLIAAGSAYTSLTANVLSQGESPFIPTVIGSVVLNTGFQAWRQKRSYRWRN